MEYKLAHLNKDFLSLSTTPHQVMKHSQSMPRQINNKKFQEEFDEKQKKAAEFIQKIAEEKKEQKRKEKIRLETIEKQAKKKIEEDNKMQQQKKEQLFKSIRNESIKSYESLKKRREEDIKKFNEAKANSILPDSEYLYIKLKEKYKNEVSMPMLEERKQELALKRNKLKMISKKEIEEHIKNHKMIITKRGEMRQQEIDAKRKRDKSMEMNLEKYKTPKHEKQVYGIETTKELNDKKRNERLEMKERRENYAKIIREEHPVIIDSSKVEELKKKVEELMSPPKVERIKKKTRSSVVYPIPNSKSIVKSNKFKNSIDKVRNSIPYQEKAKSYREIGVQLTKPNESETKVKEKKVIDPLVELKKKKGNRYGVSNEFKYELHKNQTDNNPENCVKLLGKIQSLEGKARRDEELLNIKGGIKNDLNMGESIGDMYLDAIRTKLDILNSFKQ